MYLASKIDSKLQKCPTFGSSLQNPAAFNQKGYYTKITQNDSVCLGFDVEVHQKILQGLYHSGINVTMYFIGLRPQATYEDRTDDR